MQTRHLYQSSFDKMTKISIVFISLLILGVNYYVYFFDKIELIYPPYIISTIGLFIIMWVLAQRFGLISVPFMLTLMIVFPPLAPFYAHQLFESEQYSVMNSFLQRDLNLVDKTLFFILLAMIAYCAICIASTKNRECLMRILSKGTSPLIDYKLYVFFCLLALIFAYVMEPGPTLLTANYVTVIDSRFEGVNFAGGVFNISWVLAFINYRRLERGRLFEVVTVIAALWLLLHAKRTPLLGITFILLLHLASKKELIFRAKILSVTIFLLLSLIGFLRNSPLLSLNSQTFFESVSPVTNIERGVALPGGASNVFVTMLGSVYLIDKLDYGLMYGKSYLSILHSLVPTNILELLDLPLPRRFNDIYRSFFSYNGGTYIFAPAYANFGFVGVLVLGAAMGWLVGAIHNGLQSKNIVWQVASLVIISFFPQATWYGILMLIKPVVYVLAGFAFFSIVTKQKLVSEKQEV